ncbi:hypothetical protein MesoLjLc_59510 [Mesorhizobium sp. L-8-10]|uniref:DUF5330 domain-containing protein n=1 Tax=Mesorhizobium sp. L-8-10 TaxID=2744523 RepID=UPI0019279874|nr:DUF5330 domain-containing protein [Mesorhizobium sp. L-8-10]BCH34021.1 hypothetical protein MesoLjLc_59510 [Mesorhizobium sp. L-8-10]
MRFLIRMGFWFSLVLLLLPFHSEGGSDGAPGVSPIEAVFAARDAVGDLAGICERKPDVCETGKSALQTIGVRARESARIAYELLDDRFAEPDPSLSTGGIPGGEIQPKPGVAFKENAMQRTRDVSAPIPSARP